MRNVIVVVFLGSLAAAQTPLTPSASRLLVVTTPGWDAVGGTLIRYERRHGKWQRDGRPVPVVVGKKGMAWDPQLARRGGLPAGPVKHEGDNRSPAGIFAVTRTFGFAAAGMANYTQLTAATECVDDPKSRHYTQVLDRSQTADVDWDSAEHMRSIAGYRWGAVVAYNMENPAPGGGSCIFLHVWGGPAQGTAGCTAMPESDMEHLVRWIAPGTLLAQMPAPQYKALRKEWGLP